MFLIIIIGLIGFGLYELVTTVYTVPNRQTKKSIKRLTQQKKLSEDLREFFVDPISKVFSKFIKMDRIAREKQQRNLLRVGIDITPEKYYADALVISLWILCLGALFILIGVPIFFAIAAIFAVWLFFSNIDVANKEIKKVNNAITRDLPKFVMIYDHARGDNVQLVDIIEKYREAACKEFQYDLDLLIVDLKTGSEESALISFAERTNIQELSNFVNILLGSIKGDDVSTAIQLTQREMEVIRREEKNRKILALPDKVKVSIYATGIMLAILAITPILMDMAKSLTAFK